MSINRMVASSQMRRAPREISQRSGTTAAVATRRAICAR
jgi:hypothetical protein